MRDYRVYTFPLIHSKNTVFPEVAKKIPNLQTLSDIQSGKNFPKHVQNEIILMDL